MKLYELLSAVEEEQNAAVPQMNIVRDSIAEAELTELIKNLSDIRQSITTPNIEELKKMTAEKEEIVSKAEILEEKLKCYEEADKERIARQEHLAQMKETIDQRKNADESFEGFSGAAYIEETGALIGQYGKETAQLNQLNSRLNDERAEYHRRRAEYFALLKEIESHKEKIDRLQHIDAEKGDMALTLDRMIDILQKLADSLSSGSPEQEELSAMTDGAVKILRPFISMLEIKLRDYALVLPETFLKEIGEIL